MKRVFKSKKKLSLSFYLWFIILLVALFMNVNLVNNVSSAFLLEGKFDLRNINIDANKLLMRLGFNIDDRVKKAQEAFHENEIKYKDIGVYIYNTHQGEEYIDYDVYEASKVLKEKLESFNINVQLEETSISKELSKRGLTYNDSYKITRELLESHLNDSTSLYIDLHRDSVSKNVTTYDKFAKVMFVVGGKHDTYMENYKTSEILNKKLVEIEPNISRDVFVRKTSSYNQDIAGNVILIELGGPYNNKEEVNNTIDILAQAIAEYLGV